ncbi:DUF624 domain-containing protein [Evansella sp. AB-P1]|uniref:YesL family protein n=1 Tax=Evansella sp. AB-P1 TaxID=3037653 RepID=UPI00241EDBD6|nr:DUF624 domain-containing protein [Evansella sp. AB-P1]MDG5788490.1 DUF624 domain-containing protein [Evansella sp. AB-P1]
MENSGLVGGFYRLSEWIMRLAFLNILWIIFSIAGLLLFGITPATVAVFTIIRKWFMGQVDIPIFKTFTSVFKGEFVKVNVLSFLIGAICIIIYIDFILIASFGGIVQSLLFAVLVIVSLLLLIITLYIFPVYVHYDLKFFDYLKWSLIIGLLNPAATITIMVGIIVLYQIYTFIPGFIPFFSMSLIGMAIMGPAYFSIQKIEDRKKTLQESN